MSALRNEIVQFDYGQEENYSQKKQIKRIKQKKKNNSFIRGFKNSVMITITFLLGILIVFNYALITDKQMTLNNLTIEIADINDQIDKNNITLESIKNTNNIEETAKVYLGMNYPTRKQTVFVDFTYGSNEKDTENIMAKDENILIGLIDKVVSFIR